MSKGRFEEWLESRRLRHNHLLEEVWDYQQKKIDVEKKSNEGKTERIKELEKLARIALGEIERANEINNNVDVEDYLVGAIDALKDALYEKPEYWI